MNIASWFTTRERWATILAGILLGVLLVVSMLSVKDDSMTGDEIIYPAAGYSYLLYHRYDINWEHAPLLKMIEALPYVILHPSLEKQSLDMGSEWGFGSQFFFHSDNTTDTLLWWSRMMIILLMVGFGIFLFWAIRRWWGAIAALASLFLYTFSPNIIAHGRLATLDFGVMALMFIALYFYIDWLQTSSWKNAILTGIFWGLAQVSKFTALFLIPLFIILFFVKCILHKKERKRYFLNMLQQGMTMGGIGILIIWGIYFFASYNSSILWVQENIREVTSSSTGFSYLNAPLQALNQISFLRPLAIYGMGILKSVLYNKGPITNFPQYLYGSFSNIGWWYYYIAAWIVKEALPIILGFISSILFYVIDRKRHPASYDFRDTAVWISMIGIILLMTTGDLNIGIRYFLPVFPFVYIFIGHIVSTSWQHYHGEKKRIPYAVLNGILAIWLIGSNIFIFPSYLAYFNELIGGPQNGYYYLIDSNIDWGQDLIRLNAWARTNHITSLALDYFGEGNVTHYMTDTKTTLWHSAEGIPHGYFAVSVTYLQASKYGNGNLTHTSPYDLLETISPIARIGYSINVYKLD